MRSANNPPPAGAPDEGQIANRSQISAILRQSGQSCFNVRRRSRITSHAQRRSRRGVEDRPAGRLAWAASPPAAASAATQSVSSCRRHRSDRLQQHWCQRSGRAWAVSAATTLPWLTASAVTVHHDLVSGAPGRDGDHQRAGRAHVDRTHSDWSPRPFSVGSAWHSTVAVLVETRLPKPSSTSSDTNASPVDHRDLTGSATPPVDVIIRSTSPAYRRPRRCRNMTVWPGQWRSNHQSR